MPATSRFVLLCLGLPLGLGEGTSNCGERLEEDGQCLMQGTFRSTLLQGRQSSLEGVSPPLPLCLLANLKADPAAGPVNAEAKNSYGTGRVEVSKDAAKLEIDWVIPPLSPWKSVVGIHIHEGNASTNGPILIGFCGSEPLPSFSGSCKQGIMVSKYTVRGQACNLRDTGMLCASGGNLTLEQALAKISSKANFFNPFAIYNSFYLNVHTALDNNSISLGLIRGQLLPGPCFR